MVSVEVAKVYRAGRRRYFTLKAALRAEARRLVRAKCTCEPSYFLANVDGTCKYHQASKRYECDFYGKEVEDRLVRIWQQQRRFK
jgi:hypothetical protein